MIGLCSQGVQWDRQCSALPLFINGSFCSCKQHEYLIRPKIPSWLMNVSQPARQSLWGPSLPGMVAKQSSRTSFTLSWTTPFCTMDLICQAIPHACVHADMSRPSAGLPKGARRYTTPQITSQHLTAAPVLVMSLIVKGVTECSATNAMQPMSFLTEMIMKHAYGTSSFFKLSQLAHHRYRCNIWLVGKYATQCNKCHATLNELPNRDYQVTCWHAPMLHRLSK